MRIEDEDDEDKDSSDSEDSAMENRGMVDEEEEAANFGAAQQEGPANVMLGEDNDGIGIAEARQAMRDEKEIEEAKQELAELQGSDDENLYGEGPRGAASRPEGGVEGSQESLVG